jgi:hypothetical protein
MLDSLRTFPDALRSIVEAVPPALLRTRARDGSFAVVEHAWHLADLEVDGYGERLQRIADEDEPAIADFKGDVVAEQRRYLELELEPALKRFAAARAANVARMERFTDEQWQRAGMQEGVGRVTLARVAEMMAAHDAGHAAELHALHSELTT